MNATNLQYQTGVQNSQSSPQDNEESIEGLDRYLFAGEFKRGRFDVPFKVTKSTMASILGKDSKNPYYIALEDAFEVGAEEIWVMRLESSAVKIVEPPFSAWTIKPDVTVQNGTARYTAFKKSIASRYDSFANLDLVIAVIRSLHDADMQQWQAVKDAANELTGVTNWTFDLANNRIIYTELAILNQKCVDDSCDSYPYLWSRDAGLGKYPSQTGICLAVASLYSQTLTSIGTRNNSFACFTIKSNGDSDWWAVDRNPNLNYDQNAVTPTSNISLTVIAQKIISNASSSNQAISLLAEAYLENVAKSISSADATKQFVKPADLTAIFEVNKTLTE